MPVDAPFPDLDELIAAIGEAGQRLSQIDASEGAAGNISVYLGWAVDPRRIFPNSEAISFPVPAPALFPGSLLVTGSGRRLREILHEPAANLGFVAIEKGGRTGRLYTSPRRLFDRLTSEFDSHLAVHQDQVGMTGTNFHAVVHAQPVYLTYLSHIPRYRTAAVLSRRLLRWQPETIVNLPEGLGCVPFRVPGVGGAFRRDVEGAPVPPDRRLEQARRHRPLGPVRQAGGRPDRIRGDGGPLRISQPDERRDRAGADRG